MDNLELFLPDILSNVDPENIMFSIDIDSIETESKDEAAKIYKEIQDMYFDEEFMKLQPHLVSRIRQEIYSLYVLLKMRRSDEIVHELNLKSIAANPNNASLYRALNQTQSSILSIQTKIDDKVKDIQNILKDKQLSIDFGEDTNIQEEDNTSFRGSKQFIEAMKKSL